jgi:hypothetical protein
MAFAYSRLTEITQVADSAGAVLTNASGTTTYIRVIVIHNTNSTIENVVLYNVPDNAGAVGTAAAANQFYKEAVDPNETILFEIEAPGIILEDENDTIQAVTDTASKVTIQMYGATE